MSIKVIAKSIMIGDDDEGRVVGFYNLKRVRQGEKFTIKRVEDFSHRWMTLDDDDYEVYEGKVDKTTLDNKIVKVNQVMIRKVESKSISSSKKKSEVLT